MRVQTHLTLVSEYDIIKLTFRSFRISSFHVIVKELPSFEFHPMFGSEFAYGAQNNLILQGNLY